MSDLDNLVLAAGVEIAASADLAGLDAIRVRLLGKKGEITEQLKLLGGLPPEERKAAGASINVAKEAVQAALEARAGARPPVDSPSKRSRGTVRQHQEHTHMVWYYW